MRALLDTHAWLWAQTRPEHLRPESLALIESTSNEVLFSAASAWEIAIKYRLGKLLLPEPAETYVPRRVRDSATTPLAVTHDHALRVAVLPDHHRDPFDRLLVAQAQIEGVPLVTADPVFERYEVEVIRAV